MVVTSTGDASVTSPISYTPGSTCMGFCGSVYMLYLSVRSGSTCQVWAFLSTNMPAYFAI